MNFPDWLPGAIADFVSLRIEGEPSDNAGLEQWKRNCLARGDTSEAQSVADDIACLKRLAGLDGDDRIKQAYQLLEQVFSEPFQWRNFAASAWAARMDYSEYRRRHGLAKKHADKVAKKAKELAILLDEGPSLNCLWPDAFYDMRSLLELTDGRDALWPSMRSHLWSAEENDPSRGYTMRYIWGLAPTVADCLHTVAKNAGEFEPVEYGFIGAAVGTRQSNAVTEYTRGFGQALQEYHIILSSVVQEAMVITANVVLDDPDRDITLKDVKQALKHARITRPKN